MESSNYVLAWSSQPCPRLAGSVTLTPIAGRWLRASGELDRREAVTDLPVRHTPRLPAVRTYPCLHVIPRPMGHEWGTLG